MHTHFSVLRNRDFLKLWVSQTASQLTNYILGFAVIIRTFHLTRSSLYVSLVVLSFGLATLFFGAIASVFSDRFDRKHLLVITNLLQALTIALFFPLEEHFIALLLLTFTYSALNQFYITAETPAIPNVVPSEGLVVANGFFGITGSTSALVGFLLSPLLLSTLGQKGPYVAAASLLLVATIATLLLPSLGSSLRPFAAGAIFKGVWKEWKDGLDHLRSNAAIHFPIASLIFYASITGGIIAIIPGFVEEVLTLPIASGVLVLLAPLGVGVLTGVATIATWVRRMSRISVVRFGMVLTGASLGAVSFGVGQVPNFVLAAFAFLFGYANALIFSSAHSLLQQEAAAEMRGRRYGLLIIGLQATGSVVSVVFGALGDRLELPLLLLIMGVGVTMFGFFVRFGSKSQVAL